MTTNERELKKERIKRILIKYYSYNFLINGKQVPLKRAINLFAYMDNCKNINLYEIESLCKQAKNENYSIISNKTFEINKGEN